MRPRIALASLLLMAVGSDVAAHEWAPLLALPAASSRPVRSDVEARIARVETGLLPPTLYKGQAPAPKTLADAMKQYGAVGLAVAVVDGYQVVWSRAYGLADKQTGTPVIADTLFQAGSVSKAVTAVAALRLVEEGKLTLDEDVNARLVSWKVPESNLTRERKVTLRGLLSHSAGLTVHGFDEYEPGAPLPTVRQILDGIEPAKNAPVRVDYVPGSRMRYSGGGFVVLQQLLSDVTGKPFPQLMKEQVFDRVGMKHSTFAQPLPPDLAATAASGHERGERLPGRWGIKPELAAAGLWTTPSDLARFVVELQKARLGRSSRLLSRRMAALMFAPQNEVMGLGIFLGGREGRTYFGHGGLTAGFRTEMIANLEGGKGAVVMMNSSGQPLLYEVIRSVAREYGWSDFLPRERVVVALDSKVSEAYVGRYAGVDVPFPSGRLVVFARDGHLFLGPDERRGEEIRSESATAFFSVANGANITFLTDGTGRITGLRYRWTHMLAAPTFELRREE